MRRLSEEDFDSEGLKQRGVTVVDLFAKISEAAEKEVFFQLLLLVLSLYIAFEFYNRRKQP